MITPKKVLDVDLKMLRDLSCELGGKIENDGFRPEHILYVEKAGLLVGFELAAFFGCSISGIRSSRTGTSIKSKLKSFLRILPRVVTHFLRRIELDSDIHNKISDRKITCEKGLPPKNKQILLVDDAMDTGHSLKAVIAFLEKRGYRKQNLKVAVLTTTGKNAVMKADYSLLDQVICAFPWSYDSRQFEETKGVYDTEKYVIEHFRFLPA